MARSPLPFSFTSRARPTVPPAPERLNTSMLLAILVSSITFAAVRAVTSYPPPGEFGTIRRRPVSGLPAEPDVPAESVEPPLVAPQAVAARATATVVTVRRRALRGMGPRLIGEAICTDAAVSPRQGHAFGDSGH